MEPINRSLLKTNAKKALKRNFWVIMLVCFVANFLGGQFNGLNAGGSTGGNISNSISSGMNSAKASSDRSDFYGNFNGKTFDKDTFEDDLDDALDEAKNELSDVIRNNEFFGDMDKVQLICTIIAIISLVFLLVYLIVMLISFAIGSFLGAPIGVGCKRFFMRNRLGEGSFNDLFSSFSGGKYMNIVSTMFKTNIEMFLWRLLFYFPGLVKMYQYYFVGYIMAENPDIDQKRAKELSKEMSNGHKWQIFVLELSFIGWGLVFCLEVIVLTVISCGLLLLPSMLLVYPLVGYEMATYAELYEERREYALMTGMATHEELIGFHDEVAIENTVMTDMDGKE
ncbi:MAG: DUF975 family protein [Lachnospiraceae bacterium]